MEDINLLGFALSHKYEKMVSMLVNYFISFILRRSFFTSKC
jgi:hypothetical protein